MAAGDFFKFGHFFFHNAGHGVVEFVDGFAFLEVHVRVGGGAAHGGVFRVQTAGFVFGHEVVVNHFVHLFFGQGFHHVQFVAGAETVKEVHKRHAGAQGRGLGDKRHIHGFLRVIGAEHGPAGLAHGHYVGVVAENGQSRRGYCTRRHVEHGGRQFAGDFVHIRDHQEQPLRSGKGGGQGAGSQGAVHRAGSAAFGLQLAYGRDVAPDVGFAFGAFGVTDFAHRGRRGNRVNSDYFVGSMGDVGYCAVAVHSN